jgi:hypothetical protein
MAQEEESQQVPAELQAAENQIMAEEEAELQDAEDQIMAEEETRVEKQHIAGSSLPVAEAPAAEEAVPAAEAPAAEPAAEAPPAGEAAPAAEAPAAEAPSAETAGMFSTEVLEGSVEGMDAWCKTCLHACVDALDDCEERW